MLKASPLGLVLETKEGPGRPTNPGLLNHEIEKLCAGKEVKVFSGASMITASGVVLDKCALGVGCRVWGEGCRVYGAGCRV